MELIDPDLRLSRAPDLTLELGSDNQVSVVRDGDVIPCGVRGLAVLDAFYRPTTMREAIATLSPIVAGKLDLADVITTIVRMRQHGVLVAEGESRGTIKRGSGTFDTAPIHVKMLNDSLRVQRYFEGLRRVVRPSDVVVDIGTGTGVLAIAAAMAGARHVYAIEASGIGRLAKEVFEANGLGDRITLVPGWSTQVDLPERADVLVSEIIGNEPLGEHVIEVTRDAIARHLVPDARLIPSRVRVMGLAVTIPPEELARRTFTQEAAEAWKASYNISFQPLVQSARDSSTVFFVKPHRARSWPVVAEPVELADLDLRGIRNPVFSHTATGVVTRTGVFNGVIIYFDLELGPDVWMSTHPAQADESCSWRLMVECLPTPHAVTPGDRFSITYAREGARGDTSVRVLF